MEDLNEGDVVSLKSDIDCEEAYAFTIGSINKINKTVDLYWFNDNESIIMSRTVPACIVEKF